MNMSSTSRWKKVRPALWALGMVVLVAGTGLGVWALATRRTSSAQNDLPSTSPARLTPGSDYYLYVKLIEVDDHAPGERAWDRVDGSGPDIGFRLTWRQNVIWDATVKNDTLIGSWDLMKIDLRQMLTSGGEAELEGALNAPLIHYEPGTTVDLNVWDSDTVGSDDAGTITLKLDEFGPGENALAPAGGDAKAVKRVVFALIDRRTPVPTLIQTMSDR